jgi:hypothetical protein
MEFFSWVKHGIGGIVGLGINHRDLPHHAHESNCIAVESFIVRVYPERIARQSSLREKIALCAYTGQPAFDV